MKPFLTDYKDVKVVIENGGRIENISSEIRMRMANVNEIIVDEK